jgi:hypothetical protein
MENFIMSLFEDFLKGDRHHSRNHDRHETRRYGQNGYDDHFGDQHGNYGYNNKHAIASALKPYILRLLRNKTFLIMVGIACVVVLVGVVALVAALAPLAMKLVKLIEQNGIKGSWILFRRYLAWLKKPAASDALLAMVDFKIFFQQQLWYIFRRCYHQKDEITHEPLLPHPLCLAVDCGSSFDYGAQRMCLLADRISGPALGCRRINSQPAWRCYSPCRIDDCSAPAG